MSGVKGATHVYVCKHVGNSIRWRPNVVKIGATRNVEQRVGSLCGTLIRSWHRPDDAQLIEYHAIRLVGVKPVQGLEWFAVPPEDAVRAVEAAIAKADAGEAGPSGKSVQRRRHLEIERETNERMAIITEEIRKLSERVIREGWCWDETEKTFKLPSKR
jgi:hypothetical protein